MCNHVVSIDAFNLYVGGSWWWMAAVREHQYTLTCTCSQTNIDLFGHALIYKYKYKITMSIAVPTIRYKVNWARKWYLHYIGHATVNWRTFGDNPMLYLERIYIHWEVNGDCGKQICMLFVHLCHRKYGLLYDAYVLQANIKEGMYIFLDK